MVNIFLEGTKPSDRMWIIGQSTNVAIRDAAQLLTRVALLCACRVCC